VYQKAVGQGDPNNPNQTFTLNISQNGSVISGLGNVLPGTGPFGNSGLAPGTYTVNEINIPPGWSLDNISCVDNAANSTFGTFTPGDNSIAVNLVAGGLVVCTITNNFDVTAPFIICPADSQVQCGDATDPSATGLPIVTDDIDPSPAIAFSDVFTPGCGNTGTIVRTWTATDAAGNSSSCVQTIQVVDTSAPSITCPADITVSCGNATDPGATGTATGSDACGNATISFSDLVSGSCPAGQTITRTWTATDECGNTASCEQTITVSPALPHDFVLLADDDITISGHSVSEGDIHANDDIKFKKGAPSSHTGNVMGGDDVIIEKNNTINGDVTAGDELEVDADATISGTQTAGGAVAEEPLPSIDFSAGGEDVKVGKTQTLSLPPGSYEDVKVKRQATLILSHNGITGEHFFESLDLGRGAILSIDVSSGPVVINAVDKLAFGKSSEVVIVGGESRSVTFNSLANVRVDKGARVLGTIIAPDSKVRLRKGARFQGAICAEQIKVAKEATVLHHNSGLTLPKAAPVDFYPDDGFDSEELETEVVPTEFALSQNHPNPFNPSTSISFALPKAGEVTLAIYNLRGQLVATLHQGAMAAGRQQMVWDGKDASGRQVASGVYVYRLEAGGFVATKKLMLMK
jgi:predicted acyltransferase (DUF342 family)